MGREIFFSFICFVSYTHKVSICQFVNRLPFQDTLKTLDHAQTCIKRSDLALSNVVHPDDISSLLVTKVLFKVKLGVFVIKRSTSCEEIKGMRSYLVLQGKSQKEGKQVQRALTLWKFRLRRNRSRARELCVMEIRDSLESSPEANYSRAREV
jgi:hypothetical protein